ncbi:NEW3 domain-containing protein [Radiobacillus kanasensis]|uniref:COG1470 family protein n=1 Tax=Radiobacillus kanasensis TaxID=2844358 RepID=UPI001E44E5E2|nr:NEW3 domain-containing protein [Radiobacillus kanasensis]UFT98693.1 NEW3 domain-containing protein [Radiobacillus kanasensis]
MLKKLGFIVLILFTVGSTLGLRPVQAAGELTLYTPFTGLSVTPGETISYSVDVMNDGSTIQNVTFEVENLPDGWTQTITSDGRDIQQLSVQPNSSQGLTLEVTVPLKVEKADYQFQLVANGNGGTSAELPFVTTVSEEGTFKTELTSEQPNMEGHTDSTFTYTATLKNRTAEEQNYSLSSGAPEGWGVQFKADSKNVTSVTVEPNGSKEITVEVTPPKNAKAETYQLPIKAATSSTSAETTLEAVITGSYELKLTTPSGKLSTDVTAGEDKTVDLVVENTGTATLTNVDVSASAPPNWETEFDTSKIAKIEPGQKETIQVTLKAPDDAIAGDYVTTLTAEADEASSEATFRVSVKTSTLWGFVGVIIIIAVAAGMYYLFRKYGRR